MKYVESLKKSLRNKGISGITAVGSCRVYEPLKSSGIALDQDLVYCYTHNSCEHLQLLNMNQNKAPSNEFLSKITGIPSKYKLRKLSSLSKNFYVIEISSIRILKYQNYYIQINKFSNEISRLLGGSAPLNFTSASELINALEAIKNPPIRLSEIEFYEQNEEQLLADILKIHNLLEGRVIFVSHFNVNKTGESVLQRKIIQNSLHKAHRIFNINFFDPTSAVLDYGFKNSCIDMGHYKNDFIPIISMKLTNSIFNALCKF